MIVRTVLAAAAASLLLGDVAYAQVGVSSIPGPVSAITGVSANTTGSMQTSSNNPERGMPHYDSLSAPGSSGPVPTSDVSVGPYVKRVNVSHGGYGGPVRSRHH
jgi:hypothetical protein